MLRSGINRKLQHRFFLQLRSVYDLKVWKGLYRHYVVSLQVMPSIYSMPLLGQFLMLLFQIL